MKRKKIIYISLTVFFALIGICALVFNQIGLFSYWAQGDSSFRNNPRYTFHSIVHEENLEVDVTLDEIANGLPIIIDADGFVLRINGLDLDATESRLSITFQIISNFTFRGGDIIYHICHILSIPYYLRVNATIDEVEINMRMRSAGPANRGVANYTFDMVHFLLSQNSTIFFSFEGFIVNRYIRN